MSRFLAVYGSLRPSDYNFDMFNSLFPGQIEIISQNIIVPGYKMYDLGWYPTVVRDERSSIVVDILKCLETPFNSIKYMEINAGYDLNFIEINNLECGIYTMDTTTYLDKYPVVKEGNWLEYKNTKLKEHV